MNKMLFNSINNRMLRFIFILEDYYKAYICMKKGV